MDLGEASDVIPSGRPIPDGQLVRLQGITNPKSLIWREEAKGTTHYVAKIMGTGERLLYTEEIPVGGEPRILSEFEGTIRLWRYLPASYSEPMAKALANDWGVQIDPARTYLVQGGVKPSGCE
jgi:hypothetical protein